MDFFRQNQQTPSCVSGDRPFKQTPTHTSYLHLRSIDDYQKKGNLSLKFSEVNYILTPIGTPPIPEKDPLPFDFVHRSFSLSWRIPYGYFICPDNDSRSVNLQIFVMDKKYGLYRRFGCSRLTVTWSVFASPSARQTMTAKARYIKGSTCLRSRTRTDDHITHASPRFGWKTASWPDPVLIHSYISCSSDACTDKQSRGLDRPKNVNMSTYNFDRHLITDIVRWTVSKWI